MKWVAKIHSYEITIEENGSGSFDVNIDHYERNMNVWFTSLAAAKRYVKTEYGVPSARIKWTKVEE